MDLKASTPTFVAISTSPASATPRVAEVDRSVSPFGQSGNQDHLGVGHADSVLRAAALGGGHDEGVGCRCDRGPGASERASTDARLHPSATARAVTPG